MKYQLTTAPIFIYPNYKQEFILATNAIYNRFGATLSQISEDKKEHLIAYTSKSLKREEMNYGATKLECAAIVWAIKIFTNILVQVTSH